MLEAVSTGGGELWTWYQVAGIILSLPIAAAMAWAIFRGIGWIQRMHEAIVGRQATPLSEHIPSIIERFHAVDAHLALQDAQLIEQSEQISIIEGEFHTNGGTTVKDDLRGLRADVKTLQRIQAEIRVDTKKAAVAAVTEADTQQVERDRVRIRDALRDKQ